MDSFYHIRNFLLSLMFMSFSVIFNCIIKSTEHLHMTSHKAMIQVCFFMFLFFGGRDLPSSQQMIHLKENKIFKIHDSEETKPKIQN